MKLTVVYLFVYNKSEPVTGANSYKVKVENERFIVGLTFSVKPA